ncbi:ferredoxin [Sulfitobacter sp. D35]|uniref:ferredoxin n=1 Tax=Sulfitobacter sp. D35 TaxID=3083252 RepID=UPI00296E55E3|nr:ferredoxin [Sulfitobacter sp. D35]MDW4500467.1 ferredoxin [Sulfitobacter sp. D35]
MPGPADSANALPSSLAALDGQARDRALTVLGAFHPKPSDAAPGGCRTLVLLGPDEPRFWPVFTASAEWSDGAPDPLDRWSRRVIGEWADEIAAEPLFPFGDPPHHPFMRWARRSGRLAASPIGLLVHDHAGLFVSFRGALALRQRLDLPPPAPPPCDTCVDQPCRSACPVDAFGGLTYDTAACKAFLDTPPGADCMERGCRARRACPVSDVFGRLPEQSAYHMRAFRR